MIRRRSQDADPIAIIGMGCRFPAGADHPDRFYRMLLDGVDAIGAIPADRWAAETHYFPEPGVPGKAYVRRGGFVHGVDQFEPECFHISPREARYMDPQQRLLLEVTWDAFQHAGVPLSRVAGSGTGVFIGVSTWDYSHIQTSEVDLRALSPFSAIGTSLAVTANRISYVFDLRGPSMAIDTACSSSLVAIDRAINALRGGQCEMAVAGGVNLLLAPETFVAYCAATLLSPDGLCKAFDASANGFVRSEGAGVVVLKRLADAERQGDPILAVVLASGLNQDGRTEGIAFPSAGAQRALLEDVYETAGVDPSDVGYVEAHGTGTAAGDPVEAASVGGFFSAHLPPGRRLLLGSVKTNIGHLEAASGIAALIKMAQSVRHRVVPPNLHFNTPNPRIDFAALGLEVPTQATPWPEDRPLALAGANSFGFGGANAHVLISEYRRKPRRLPPAPAASAVPLDSLHLLPVTARSGAVLRQLAGEFAAVLRAEDAPSLADVCYSAAKRRTFHDHRLTVTAADSDSAAASLERFAKGEAPEHTAQGQARSTPPGIVFVFSGQGTQWPDMGLKLTQDQPVFADVMRRCDALYRKLGAPWSLLEEIGRVPDRSRLQETYIAQPAIFAIQASLLALWRLLGVEPVAVLGHSIGEVAAAHAAGIFDLDEAATLAYHRGRTMGLAVDGGRMLAADLSEPVALERLMPFAGRVSLGAINGPSSVTFTGRPDDIGALERQLEEEGVWCRRLNVSRAFHSPDMDAAAGPLLEAIGALRPHDARCPFISTVTGGVLDASVLGADYWWKNVRLPVRFHQAMQDLMAHDHDVFVELGPHPALLQSMLQCAAGEGRRVSALASMRRGQAESETLLDSLGTLFTLGVDVSFTPLGTAEASFVRLPPHPWTRSHYWNEAPGSLLHARDRHPLLGRRLLTRDPTWRQPLDLTLVSYLADHRVDGRIVVPGAALVEMALAAARELLGEVPCELEQVRFRRALILPDKSVPILETRVDTESARIEIASAASAEDADWTVHFSAAFGGAEGLGEPADLEPLERATPDTTSVQMMYEDFSRRGLQFGPNFQCVRELRRGTGRASARVALAQAIRRDDAPYCLHPALMDGGFQTLSATLPSGAAPDLYLPERIERIVFSPDRIAELSCHAKLLKANELVIDGDLAFYTTDGRPVVRVEGFRARRTQFSGRSEESAAEACLYEERWEKCPLPQPVSDGNAESLTAGAIWLIFADRSGLANGVVRGLTAQGARCVRLYHAEQFRQKDAACFEVRAGLAEDLRKVLRTCTGEQLHLIRGVVHLWALDETEMRGASEMARAETRLCHSLMHLVQALDERSYDVPTRLLVVTRGGRALANQAPSPACQQSMLVGLSRVIANEMRHYEVQQVDLDPGRDLVDAAPLLAEIFSSGEEEEVALRGGDRWIPRLGHARAERVRVQRREQGLTPPVCLVPGRRGALSELDWQEAARRAPGPDQIEIAISHVGLNFRDVLKALGIYPADTPSDMLLGDECVGTVLRSGDRVDRFKAGDRVIALSPGCLSSHAVVDTAHAMPLPTHYSPAEAVTLPVVFLTAQHALHGLARIRAGDTILIHSAAGGVGMAAMQVAAQAGARIFATAGSDEKRDLVRKLGAEHVMSSRSLEFAEQIRTLTDGRGVDIVLNSLSGRAMIKSLECLAPYGRFLELGKRDIHGGTRIDLWPFRNNIAYFAIDLAEVLFEKSPVGSDAMQTIASAIAERRFEPLPCQIQPATSVGEAFRAMSQGRHTGKIAIDICGGELDAARAPAPAIAFSANAAYLITGGLGGFGLALARYLVDHGARHLALLGRRPPSEDIARILDQMRQSGARVAVFSCDVADEEALAATLQTVQARMPPLRGVFHLAAVLEDGILLNLGPARFSRVTRPKALGAWNLHRMTLDLELDHFVMFGSISAAIGNPGQANYAAANAFLEGLAALRHARGLPAKTVAWGMLRDTGMTAGRDGLRRISEQRGLRAMTADECLSLLPALLKRNNPCGVATRIDWTAFSRAFTRSRASRSLLAEMMSQAESAEVLGGDELVRSLIDSPPAERLEGLTRYLTAHVSRILGASAEDIDPERPLHETGFDSLMLVELAVTVQDDFGSRLPSASISPSGSIHSLAATVSGKLASAGSSEADLEGTSTEPAMDTAIFRPIVMRQSGDQTPLFLIHPLGVHEGVYRPLVNALAPCRPVYGISSNLEAGPGGRPVPIDTRVEAFVETIREIQPRGPYLLCGYSMGGHLAMKTAATLEALGETVDFVGLIEWELSLAAVAADIGQTQRQAANLFVAIYRLLETRFGVLAHLPQERLVREASEVARHMTTEVDGANVSVAYEWMVEKGYLIKNVSRDLLEGYFGQLFVNFTLMAADSPVHPVRAPVYVWRARDGLGVGDDPRMDLVPNLRAEELVDGDHFSLMIPPSCTVLASRINQCLRSG